MSAEPTRPTLLAIDDLNHLAREQFGPALSLLFEAAGPLAVALYGRRPFGSYEELLEHAETVVWELLNTEKVTVINAHPRIGAPPEALRRTSIISYREQGYERDSAETEAVLQELERLNVTYEERFGFRFVVFVNRRSRSKIVEILKQRLGNAREAEMATALRDMLAIARDRLRRLRGDGYLSGVRGS